MDKKAFAEFESYLDGCTKYGLRYANMRIEHFAAMLKKFREMQAEIQRLNAEIERLTK